MSKQKNKMMAAMNTMKSKREGEYITLEGKIENLTREKTDLQKENEKLKKEALIKKTSDPGISEGNVPENKNELENEILSLKQNINQNGWLIGQRLSKINELKLFKPDYQTFYEYCQEKLEIVKQTAYNMIYIYKEFSMEQVKTFGSKLYLLQRIKSSDERQKILSWMESTEPSYRAVEEQISRHIIDNKSDSSSDDNGSNNLPITKGRKKITIEYSKLIQPEKQDEFYNKLENLVKEYISY